MKKFKPYSLLVLALTIFIVGCEPTTVQTAPPPSSPQAPPEQAGQATASTSGAPQVESNLLRRNFYIVLDGSGSMNEIQCSGNSTKIEVAKKAVIDFERSLNASDNIGLVVFDNAGISERAVLGTSNRRGFEDQVNAVRANNGTPLYECVKFAFGRLEEQRAKQLGYGEYHIVIITDGEASDSENGLIAQVNKTPVVIHTIGFCIGEGHSLNQRGKTYYTDAQSPEEVKKGFKAVTAESEKFDK
ncbi:MAG: VWA domain-containing protein [Candidatus Pacebacteria bacterium]|nr:VWA domain-containing protein [Candidatus Paceibacterota bacterium]